jgi:hypothetical protein
VSEENPTREEEKLENHQEVPLTHPKSNSFFFPVYFFSFVFPSVVRMILRAPLILPRPYVAMTYKPLGRRRRKWVKRNFLLGTFFHVHVQLKKVWDVTKRTRLGIVCASCCHQGVLHTQPTP